MCDEKRASEVGQLCARPGGGMEDGVGAGVQSAEGGAGAEPDTPSTGAQEGG